MHVLAIDLGTSGVKVGVFDRAARLLGAAAEPVETRFTADGGAEQDAQEWWAVIGRCARAAVRDSGVAVAAVAVTAQYLSTVAIDRAGRPLSPVTLWMDHRGGPLHPLLDDDQAFFMWLERHGLPPMSNDGLAHIALLRARDPSLVERGAVFVEPVDAIIARLTGRAVATQTSALGLMAIDNRVHGSTRYDAEMMETAGLDPSWLPTLVPLHDPLGELTPLAADHLGVPASAVVLPGTIDSITSAVGTGAIGPHAVSLVIGTTSVIVSHVAGPQADLDNAITAVPSPVGDQYFVLAENGVGGKALEFLLRNIVYPEDALAVGRFPIDAFHRAETAARGVATGANGTMFLPWLVGSMAPAPADDMRAGFVNLGLTTTRADLVRAVYEGVALNAAWLFDPVCRFTGHDHRGVCFGGGGARSALWGEILAGALGVTVNRLAEPEHTNCRGAALLALVHLGEIVLADVPNLLRTAAVHEPDADLVARYATLRERLVEYHGLTRAFHGSLTEHP